MKLEELFLKLKEENRRIFQAEFKSLPESFITQDKYDFLTDFLNSLIVGAVMLKGRDHFRENKDIIISVFKTVLGQPR